MAGYHTLEPGEILGARYRIEEQVGQGGMAAVYRATQPSLERNVAIKVIHADLAHKPEFLKRFHQEAQRLATLRHPNVVHVYDFAAEEALCYMVMEYLPGDTLALKLFQHTRRGAQLPLAHCLQTALAVGGGLRYAHQRGLVHRDIKPANVLFDGQGTAVLTDFGIARLLQADVGMTAPEVLVGTPSHVAPELVRGDRGDVRADIYSFGVLLFEMLTGRLPFETDNALAMVSHHLETPPPRPGTLRAELPARLDEIVLRALAKHPELRYQTMDDVLHELEDLDRPVARAALTLPEMAAATPLLPLLSVPPPNNLPAQLTSFVGRQRTVAEIAAMLRSPAQRLVTLSGPGGVGKTRLSLQVAQALLADFPDGVFFVPLAAVGDAAQVAPAIVHALGLLEESGTDRPVDQLRAYLRERRVLLVLDNFEQVLAAAPQLTELSAAAPDLSLLVTSREVLHVYGEQAYPVPPLDLPELDLPPTVSRLGDYAALALFEARAQAVDPAFRLTPENIDDVARICRVLDGLPLAIELAAARIQLLSPAALLARLAGAPGTTGALKVLRGRARDLPARQQTLRGAIDWSYDLLDASEKQLFMRLGVFVGARSLPAIEAVCDIDGDLAAEPLEGLASLVDKSLLRQREGVDREPAFFMLTTIQEYALERLTLDGNLPLLRRRHAYFFANLAETAEQRLQGAEQEAWLDLLEQQHGNLRAALAWALESGDGEVGCRLCAALWRFWRLRGHIGEGRERTTAVLARAGGVRQTRAYARAVLAAGHLAYLQSDFQAAGPLYAEAQALLTALGDGGLVGQVRHNIGMLAFKQGDYEQARRLYGESLVALEKAGDPAGVASVLNSQGNLAWLTGDFRAARHYYGRSSEQWRALGNKHNAAMVANNLGAVAMTTGDFQAAREIFLDCLAIHRELRNQNGVALALSNLAEIALEQGDLRRAHSCLAEALTIQRELARKERIAILLEGFGRLAVRQDQARRAALLYGAAERLREEIQAPQPEIVAALHAPDLAAARAALGGDPFAATVAQGRRLNIAAAMALALEETETRGRR